MTSISRLLLAALILLPAAVQAQTPDAIRQEGAVARHDTLPLRPGDVLRITVWREPEFSGDVPVLANGTAVFPRLGPVEVAGIPADSVERLLTTRFSEYLNTAAIAIIPMRLVTVSGAVKTPGAYPVDPTRTISSAVAAAGGLTPDAGKSIELWRDGRRIKFELDPADPIANAPVHSGDEVHVGYANFASRNPTVLAAAITGVISLFVALHR